MKFVDYEAYEVADSRGKPTIAFKAQVGEQEIVSQVPSGTSAGSHEAQPLPVPEAIAKANELKSQIVGQEYGSIEEFDQALIALDGTPNKAKLGANTILGLSMLFCRLAAVESSQELWEWLRGQYLPLVKTPLKPKHQVTPMMVMVEGGVHAESGTKMQEILINGQIPAGKTVWEILNKKGYAMGMEGGFDIPFHKRETADHDGITTVQKAILDGQAVASISVDVAANEIPADERYSVADIIAVANEFKLESIEDPFTEDDWEPWSQLVREISGRRLSTAVVGDDLTVTNVGRLEEVIAKQAATGVIVKPNQVGSISETFKFVALARDNNFTVIVSHRSGETSDDFIADLAVAVQADFIKTGAPSKPERMAKYNRLEEIQKGQNAQGQPGSN